MTEIGFQMPKSDVAELRRRIVPASFYARPAEVVAISLLGQMLVKESPQGVCAGRIVETEAYLACGDAGCHAWRGMTARNSVMWAAPGTAYVYTVHTHCLINAVTGALNFPEAVLIRALEPVLGLELMRSRRKRERLEDLASGPGKLTEALGIDLRDNRLMLDQGPVFMARGDGNEARPIATSTRIGLSEGRGEDLPLRYYYADSDCVSVNRKAIDEG
jgi:DNA-3-methyladenine glycosylase